MKHIGSREDLLGRTGDDPPEHPLRAALSPGGQRQHAVSIAVALACGLLLVAMVADAPVRNLARSLDPSLGAVLHRITDFGNSAWPLGIGLALLALVAIARRQGKPVETEALDNLRSVLLLVVGSVAISGAMASLAKNLIGRVRPSTGPDVGVLDFSVMAFRAGWASFPSGHATTATACALALAICFPRLSWAWLSVGLLAALSRALLGVHWLSDCLAGIALGAAVTLGLRAWLVQRGHRLQVPLSVPLRVVATAGVLLYRSALRQGGRLVEKTASRARR